MNIIEKINNRKSKIMMCYNINPKYLYIGENEYAELKELTKYYNICGIKIENETEVCCDLEIIKVKKESHLGVY